MVFFTYKQGKEGNLNEYRSTYKKQREELGMSQEDLAHKIGYKSKSSINKIELDIQQLRQSKIKQIADALETTTDYIMGWSEKKNDEPKEKHDVTDLIKNQYGSDVYELVQLYSKLNEAGKNKIMEELRDTAALPKYTEPVKRDAQKMA